MLMLYIALFLLALSTYGHCIPFDILFRRSEVTVHEKIEVALCLVALRYSNYINHQTHGFLIDIGDGTGLHIFFQNQVFSDYAVYDKDIYIEFTKTLINVTYWHIHLFRLYPQVWLSPHDDFEMVFLSDDTKVAEYKNGKIQWFNTLGTGYSKIDFPDSLIPVYASDDMLEFLLADTFHAVARIIDGNTFVMIDSTRVRLIGIDAPEVGQPGASRATAFLKTSILNENITIRYDYESPKIDQYGHTLAYVFVGDFCINEELLKKGLARTTPDCDFKERIKYIDIENMAKHLQIGIWKK